MESSPQFPRLQVERFAERTLPAMLVAAARRWPARCFLRFLDPETDGIREVSFEAFARGAAAAAALLRAARVEPGDRVLLLAENSPDWQMVAFGAQLLRAEPAALFASLAAEPVQGIARRVRPRVIFVSGAEQWAKLAPVADELVEGGLAAVLSSAPLDPAALQSRVRRVGLDEVLGETAPAMSDEELAALAEAVGQEDPFLLLFTSGTTGRPKGVRLPQRAIVHAIDAGQASVGTTAADVGLHFLPFGHVAGHDQFALALAQGHELIMTARREDLERGLALGPTYLFSVPLVYERIRASVVDKIATLPAPLRILVRSSLAAAERHRLDGSTHWRHRIGARLGDRLVGRAVRARLGGRVRGLFAGGAPSAPALFRFFESLGLPFVELYGMSETAGMISSNLFAGPRHAGCTGKISADHEVRLAEDGELQIRGPLLLSGFLEPEDDCGAWTDDGYFRTGDLARLDAEGFLFIEGRRKNLMVLSTGKKLSPEPIELAIAGMPPFHGAVLLGEGMPFVAAAVFVAREELNLLAERGQDAAAALLPRVRAALASFSEFEVPKRLLVIPGAPEEHPAFLTPTLKLRRDVLVEWLGESIPRLFATGSSLS